MKELLFKLLKKAESIWRKIDAFLGGFGLKKLFTRFVGQGIVLGCIYGIGLIWIDPAPLSAIWAFTYFIVAYLISMPFFYWLNRAWIRHIKFTDGTTMFFSIYGEIVWAIFLISVLAYSGDLSA
ncbi:hypothetical protein [Ornithobacterium rhinotracheale]|uniref:hypothetical protein n=1 Tax=Ornithobacterium rhinotracheale TaxID=28251 RepID=UPI001FF340E1|nr:hypothetical protein [Ornithobacterium rhinotracheale]MCK0206231.1 hypothetical protein [Ornithobacterium rhinotracheale]